MYIIKKQHTRPTYRKGDLEVESVVIDTKTFRLKSEATAWINRELKDAKNITKSLGKGKIPSYYRYYTGKTWVHENTGEPCHEYYTYILSKE